MPPPQASSSVAVTAFVALVSAFALGAVSGSLLSGACNSNQTDAAAGGTVGNADDRPMHTTHPDSEDKSNEASAPEDNSEDDKDDGDNNTSSINLHPIGKISSVYRLCVGTPRQGLLAPNSRGRIELSPSLLSADSILGLDGFSHLWVVFIFHLNTNTQIVKKSAEAAAKTTGKHKHKKKGGGGGSRQFPSKIAPPALGGEKVGLFSTRTPHRPNPIGLTLCKIDSISRGKDPSQPFYVNVSGLDLVDGTPVLDIKPFVPHYDTVISLDDIDGGNVIPRGVSLPHWVGSGLEKRRNVSFTDEALLQLDDIVRTNPSSLEFYGPHSGRDDTIGDGIHAIRNAIIQVLAVDIRSKWQTGKARKGKFQAERAGRVKDVMSGDEAPDANDVDGEDAAAKKEDEEQQQLCTQQLDNLLIKYSVSAPSDGNEDAAAMGSGANDDVTVRAIELLRACPGTEKEGGDNASDEVISTNGTEKSSEDTSKNGDTTESTTNPEGESSYDASDKTPAKRKGGSEEGEADGPKAEPPKEFGALKDYWSARGDANTPSGLTPSASSTEKLDKQAGGRVLSFSNRRILTPPRDVVSRPKSAHTSEINKVEVPGEAPTAAVGTSSEAVGEIVTGPVDSHDGAIPLKQQKSEEQPEDATCKEQEAEILGTAKEDDKRVTNGGDMSKSQTDSPLPKSDVAPRTGSSPGKKKKPRPSKKKRQREKKMKAGQSSATGSNQP